MTQLFPTEAAHKPAIAYGGPLPVEPHTPLTLPQALYRAVHQERETGIIYFQPDGTDLAHSYAALSQEAECILAGLRAHGLRPGEKVLLQVEENRDYLPTFWACVLGGFVAVPISIAPGYTQPNITTARLQKAWELCERPLIVASPTLIDALHTLWADLGIGNVRVESIDALRSSGSRQNRVSWHEAQPDDDVLILFTSGSTGVPKGVMLTHRNILGVARGFSLLEGLSPQEITFNWMPLDHIGGLVTFHLRDVFLGCQQIHASPQAVLQSPLTWLDCLDRYRATCTWAPNFAFSMINEQAPALAAGHWDLSSLRYILNAGEAIVPKTARCFLELLRPHGLASTAIHPSWGMSETSSGVTFSSTFSLEATSDEDRFVDVGALIPEVWVRIVDLHDQMLAEGETGRIQVRGPTVTRGYYHNADLNREVFTGDGWFDTGDLGMLRASRLTVTGRSKHVIIINGLNYYSHEIEAVVEEIPGVEATFTAACAVRDASSNTDALAIFYHTRATRDEEIQDQFTQIRRRVIQAIGINPTYLLPLEAQAIPKTETGKIQRTRLKQMFEEGAFASLLEHLGSLHVRQEAEAAPLEIGDENTSAVQLTRLWQRLLSLPALPSDVSFFELGGDSLLLMQLLSQIRTTFGIALTPRVVFDFPTIASLAREIEAHQKMQGDQALLQLLPVTRERDLPLSFTQRRLWFLEQLRPGDTAYTSCSAFRFSGQLSLPTLQRSLQEIVRRHEVFRTTFVEKDEQPVLHISPGMEIPLLLIELGHLPTDEQEHAAYEYLSRALDRPFDLTQGPLVRFLLLRLRPDEHIFATVISHLISDGWSLGIFNRELADLYDAFRQGKPSPLPDLPFQFADYAFWQHQWFQGAVQRREIAYWKEHLQGAPALLELPTDHPRQPVQAGRLALHHFDISLELTQSLNALARRENVTLFMLFLAALKVLLYRYTHQPDIVVGTVSANRGDTRLEALIGFFANTLALRTTLSASLSFHDLLQKIREELAEAYSYAETPFGQVVNVLHIEQNLSYAPLLQVAFFLQDEQMYRPHFRDLQVKPFPFVPFPFRSGIARFDLLLEVTETEAGLAGSFEYDSELFEHATVIRLLGHWQTLLEGIIANPHQTVAQLPLLTAAERRQLLVDWNATASPLPTEKCFHHLFEEQAERTPHALAATFEGGSLTYRELNERANQLAHYLQTLGVGPEVLVGVYLERSLDMLVALLGILKAGGAYVPLDPKLPGERLALQLRDAQVAVLLTQERLHAALVLLPEHVLSMDTQWELLAHYSTQNPISHTRPFNLAYLMYTSGSTGKPKGVQILHHSLLNFLLSMQQQPGLDEQDILLAITTISFDIAGLELFLPLLCGARVVIASQEAVGDSVRLASLLATSGATVMQATPATWRLLLDNGWEGLPSLKALCGGEALPRNLANQLLVRTRELWNLYGPTETTIWSTIARVEGQEGPITIGHPLANTQIYLLDKHLQPVPVGVTGEVYIGGSGLARGYFRRPELTRERFLPHPFSQDADHRLYLTGDLARYLPDGSIEYLGRNDFQVKVHGYRIELEEIEAALLQHPAVGACVVAAVDGNMGNRQLAAYLIPRSEQAPGVEELRHFLEKTLPAYMIPAFFVLLQEFPLTPNGKVDRKALPEPDESRPVLTQSYIAPQTPEEQLLAALWSRVLRIERIGIYDNFFSLGGDSLLSMSVLSGARKQGLDFSLQEFFQYPRIHDLARAMRKRDVKPETESGEVLVGKTSAQLTLEVGEVPLLPGQGWQLLTLRNPHHFNVPLLFSVRQPLDLRILQQTILYLVSYHDALRLRFYQKGTAWKQFLLDRDQEEILPIMCVDVSTLPEAEQRETVLRLIVEVQPTLNLCQGPLSRVIYFDMGAGREGRLFWVLNHIICDFISHLILAEDFLLVYHQLAQGKPADLPGQRTSLKRWAECLHEHICSAALQEELEGYWLKLPWDKVKR
ncbi:MAG TPA: amino acid adenylation domain-containing protein, partial [Ktedonobacteraceae bacterium]|nr:amino acid adenylation domain-containing protein [Ktedonobacteraceae bacterium]